MKVNKYFPFAFIYFFINSLALPFGLTYTALLAPLFYVWILLKRKKEVLFPFIVILAPFILAQVLYADVVRKVYFYSLINLVLVYIFCQAVYTFLKVYDDVEKIFQQLLIINFILCLIAIFLYFTSYYQVLWIEQSLTEGISDFRRLKLFTYEASYYATLFAPLFCFYMLQYLFNQNGIKGWLLLLMIFLPYVLSFSFGVMGALVISGLLTYLLYFRKLTKKRRIFNGLIFSGGALMFGGAIIYFFFRNSFFVLRLENIFSGRDSSGKGRTFDAYYFANKLLERGNEYWGIGLGQIKIKGEDLLRSYYLYDKEFVATIPNAVAETFTVFGWMGLALRLFVELFLFFYTKVWTNYYRLWLFLFIFIFQFIGSFITNIAEYVIWIFAFTNVFRQFDVERSEAKASFSAAY
ncbi:MAG TPA: hypothetical protein VGQ09_23355 [Chitinophagaceae bacterium]|jgi:hypothetical protein|nr:hypothetical protein [Chitinophagaceae bacterium]